MNNHIKVNLPSTQADYECGNGEGCWFIVDDATKAAHDSDAEHGEYWGILDNDSLYFKGLMHGERLPLEMRGTKRPVVPYGYLIEHYELNDDFFNDDTPDYCPLCGNDNPEVGSDGETWGVYCGFCNCRITGYKSRAAAVKQWNHRFVSEG